VVRARFGLLDAWEAWVAIKRIGLGGFGISVTASEHEAGLHISLGGSLWERFARVLKRRRNAQPENSRSADAATDAASPAADDMSPSATLARRIKRVNWYHTFDFGNGIRTPGAFDHTPILDQYNLPERFDGKRVLDVATFDGFWAFEFEKRGAKEVLALDLEAPRDLDWPPKRLAQATPEELGLQFGEGFAIAKEQIGSSVRRVVCNVYDLKPETFGLFDVVHSGDLLLHLNSPIRALQNMARVCTDYALISDVYFPDLDHLGSRALLEYMGGRDSPTWWKIGLRALQEMTLDAGFARIEVLSTFSYGYRAAPGRMQHAVLKAYK
jgi:tRNA (mo5U34)-methyltransferase